MLADCGAGIGLSIAVLLILTSRFLRLRDHPLLRRMPAATLAHFLMLTTCEVQTRLSGACRTLQWQQDSLFHVRFGFDRIPFRRMHAALSAAAQPPIARLLPPPDVAIRDDHFNAMVCWGVVV